MLTVIAVILRVLVNPLGNVFQKKLTARSGSPIFVNFVTYFLLAILSIMFAFRVDWTDFDSMLWIYAILVGITGAAGNALLVMAIQRGELSVLGPINAYKSVIGMIVGIFLLNQIPNLWGCVGIALIIFGSYFVLDTSQERFSFALFRRLDIQYRLWAMILSAIEAVFIKKVIEHSNPEVSMITWCWFGAVFSGVMLIFVRREQLKHDFRQIRFAYDKYFALVLCVGLMQLSTNYALDRIPVGYALALFQLSAIVSVFFGYHIFNEKSILQKLTGSLIMFLGSVAIIFH